MQYFFCTVFVFSKDEDQLLKYRVQKGNTIFTKGTISSRIKKKSVKSIENQNKRENVRESLMINYIVDETIKLEKNTGLKHGKQCLETSSHVPH